MKNTLPIFLAAFGFLWLAPSAQPHHGWMDFDPSRELTFQATVTDFHFVNPHCVVEFSAMDEKGQVQKWQGEFSNPHQLAQKGWTASSLDAGDKITIAGNPAKNSSLAIHVTRIRLPNGQELKIADGR
jgi:Family of unknown function (DUF6152)